MLVAAVLSQGIMLVRSPVHLGLIESQSLASVAVTAPVAVRLPDLVDLSAASVTTVVRVLVGTACWRKNVSA